MSTCKICGNPQNNRLHTAREMMLGTRDAFAYLECGKCGTLQITEVPALERYYPREYYSFETSEMPDLVGTIKKRLAVRLIGRHFVTGKNPIGKYLARGKPWLSQPFPLWLSERLLNVRFNMRILDYGCGSGRLLRTLRAYGFKNLTGADAFLESDLAYPGVRIFKRELADFDATFDLILLNHSFEHLPEPKEALYHIHRLLDRDGTALIRIPIVNFAWEKYGVNWVQMDPPRHLYVYTERSFRIIAKEAGFEVAKVVYDSEAFQFHGSEQYLMDIPMNDPRAFTGVSETSIFSQQQFDKWQKMAEKLNEEGRGDQACFYLRKL